MKKVRRYKAKVMMDRYIEFEFTEEEMDPEDSLHTAAEELALSYPSSCWDSEDMWSEVEEIVNA